MAQVKLCNAVFDSPYSEAAFDEIVAKQTSDLTKFGQGILHSKRAPEKVSRWKHAVQITLKRTLGFVTYL